MPLYIAKFGEELADVILEAPDGDGAIEALRRHDVDGTPKRLIELPSGLFCAEIRWVDEHALAEALGEEHDDDAAGGDDPALLPFDGLAKFLDVEDEASEVIDAVAPNGGA